MTVTTPPGRVGTQAAWRRRFRAAHISLPGWGRDRPDRCLYASNASGKWELYTWDLPGDRHRQVTDRPEGTRRGALDPLGKWIWWFDDRRGDELGRWVREPFGGGERRLAAPELRPAYSAGLALAQGFAVVGSSDDDGVAIHRVEEGAPALELYRHHEDAGVAGLSRDETHICLSHSEHGDSRHPALRVIDPAGKPVAPDLWDGPGHGLWASEWSPIPGDQRLVVVHERRDLPRPMIWRLDTQETTELSIDLPGEVDATWYPDARALLLAHDYRGRSELYRLDLDSEALTPVPVEPGNVVYARVRPDGEVWYAWTRSSAPAEIRAGDRVLLRAPGEPAPGGVAYSDHDVHGIHVFLAEPVAVRPHPAVFLVHGGPEAHDRDAFSPLVQAWVDHGFAVVLANYRGSTGYGKAWRDALQGNVGFSELEDVAKVQDWMLRGGIIDPRRCILAGASWGGYVTLLGIGMQPERWSLGIAAVPVADYVAAFQDEMEPLKALDRALCGGTPDEIPEFYRARSPITYADQVRVPVMILAGQNDPRCPIRQIENYLARLRDLNKPHEVYRYDAGHGSLVIEETLRQVEAQIAFAARHLGTQAPLP